MISQNAFLEILAYPQDSDALSPWSVWQRWMEDPRVGRDGSVLAEPTIAFCFAKIEKGAFLTPEGGSWSLCLLMSLCQLEAGPPVASVSHVP